MKKNIIIKFSALMLLFGILIIIAQSYNIRQTGINQGISEARAITEVLDSSAFNQHSKDGSLEQADAFLNALTHAKTIDDIWIVRSNKLIEQYGKSSFFKKYDSLDKKALISKKPQYKVIETLTNAKLRVSVPYILNNRTDKSCISCHIQNENENFAVISMTLDMSGYKEYGFKISIIISILILLSIVILSYMLSRILMPYTKTIESLTHKIDLASNGNFETIDKNPNYPIETNKLVDKYNYLSTSLNDIFMDIDIKLRSFIGDSISCDSTRNSLIDARDVITQLSLIYEFKQQIHLDNTKDEMYTRLSEIYKKQFNITCLNIYEVDDKLKLTKMFQMGNKDFCINNITDDPNKCRVYKNADDVYSLDFHKACNCFNSDAYFHYCIDIEVGKNSKVLFNFIFDSSDDFEEFKTNLSFIKHYIKEISYEVSTKTLVKELEDMALKDALTGLYNRKFLENYISTIIPIAKREKYNIGFLMLDMDHFKAVNDEYGHDVGDKVLKSFATTVLENIRDSDVVIRFGGEEFIVLLVNIKSEEDVINIANKIRVAVANTEVEVYAGSTIKKTVSIGVSMYPQDSSSFERIMKLSDIALYEAKESGRNKIVRYKEKPQGEVELF